MNWFSMALMAMTKIPMEKIFVRKPDPMKTIEKFESIVAEKEKAKSPISEPVPQEHPEVSPPGGERVSTEETVAYQKRELGKEILLLEKHLQQKCKIAGKACDCCEKHPIVIEALAQETLGITGDPLFGDVVAWAKRIAPITTEAASRSGQYDEEYPDLAVQGRNFRKRIMGTAAVQALLTPALSEKVDAQVQEIMDRAMKKEGGNDGKREQATL